MDYNRLLYKYIDHIAMCEGITFIPKYYEKDNVFTKEELVALWELEEELDLEYKALKYKESK